MPSMPSTHRPRGAPTRRERRQEYDRRRDADSETRRLYKTARWQKLRALHLKGEPTCRMCRAEGRYVAASVVDHVDPHRGVVEKFWSGPFQALCKRCHDSVKQKEEAAG